MEMSSLFANNFANKWVVTKINHSWADGFRSQRPAARNLLG